MGQYTHRVAISNSRLLTMQDGKVSFRYRDRYYGILATANITTKREQSISLIGETMWLSQLEGLNAYELLRFLIDKDPALCPVCKEGFMRRYKELIQKE